MARNRLTQKWATWVPLCACLLLGSLAEAKSLAYKYQMKKSFGISASCDVEGETELSQVRLYVDQKELETSTNVVDATTKITACVFGGKYIKKAVVIPLPAEFLKGGEIKVGKRRVKDDQFTHIEVETSADAPNSYQIRYFTPNGPWDVVNPIQVQLGDQGKSKAPVGLKMYLPSKSKWIEATFRHVEVQ